MDVIGTPLNSKTSKFTIPPSPYLQTLGYGTGVKVYRLNRSLQDGISYSPWAIKRVNTGNRISSLCKERIAKEAKILKTLSHPNIVGFRALVHTEDGQECLAMEECTIGLGDMIVDRSEKHMGAFPVGNIFMVGLCMSRALDYLHRDKRILHGDIKSHNVLIKGDFEEVKLCDFGVSLPLNVHGNVPRHEVYTGTELWSAPEVLRDEVVSSKADIFSLGLVLWEMMTLCMPHMPMGDDSLYANGNTVVCDDDLPAVHNVDSSSSSDGSSPLCGTRPPLDKETLGEEYGLIIEVFEKCTEEEPSQRPSAEDLVQLLEPHVHG